MSKFDIMLYLMPNLALCIAFAKFNAKFDIPLEKAFYAKMLNFGIGTQIWHCIWDTLINIADLFCFVLMLHQHILALFLALIWCYYITFMLQSFYELITNFLIFKNVGYSFQKMTKYQIIGHWESSWTCICNQTFGERTWSDL